MVQEGYENILLVSFTNDSSEEIKLRLSKELSESELSTVSVSTIHTALLTHIKSNLGHGLLPESQSTVLQIKALQSQGLSIRDLGEFKRAIDSDDSEEFDLFKEAKEVFLHSVLNSKNVSLATVIPQAVEWMIQGKLPPLPYRHIFVDEFQDVDQHQLHLFLLHGLAGVNMTCTGDDDQSIYGFRNAKGVNAFLEFEKVLKAKRLLLTNNYRSQSEILHLANMLIQQNTHRVPKELVSYRGKGGHLSFKTFGTPEEEAQFVCKEVLLNPEQKTLILARNARYLFHIDSLLSNHELDYLNQSNKKSPVGLSSQIASTGLIALSSNNVSKLTSFLQVILEYEQNTYQIAASIYNHQTPADISDNSRHIQKGLSNAQKLFEVGKINDGLVIYFTTLSNHLNLLGYADVKKLPSLENYLKKVPGSTLAKRVTNLTQIRRGATGATIQAMTMHGSKGLEAPRVFVLGVSERIIPSAKAMSESTLIQQVVEEERRLLFVAMTRAQDSLTITSVKGTSSQSSRYGVSPLLTEDILGYLTNENTEE